MESAQEGHRHDIKQQRGRDALDILEASRKVDLKHLVELAQSQMPALPPKDASHEGLQEE